MICYCHTNLYDIVIVSESIDKQSLCQRTSRVIVQLDEFGANVAELRIFCLLCLNMCKHFNMLRDGLVEEMGFRILI